MRGILLTIFALWLCGLCLVAHADTYSLTDGTSVSGDIVTFDDFGVKLRTPDGNYSDRVPWSKFSQEGLKQLANNPRSNRSSNRSSKSQCQSVPNDRK